MSKEINNPNECAKDLLKELYNVWSDVSVEDGQEFRSPKTRREIRISRGLLRKVKKLNITEEDLIDRIEELESVVDSVDAGIPKLMWRVFLSVFISVLLIIGNFILPDMYENQASEFDYDESWFTTEKGGYITYIGFVSEKGLPNIDQKVWVKAGTNLKPMGRMGSFWLQVETPDGQRGFINYKLLKGANYIEADDNTVVFNKIGSKDPEPVTPGIRGLIINRKTKDSWGTKYDYCKKTTDKKSVKTDKFIAISIADFKQVKSWPSGRKIYKNNGANLLLLKKGTRLMDLLMNLKFIVGNSKTITN